MIFDAEEWPSRTSTAFLWAGWLEEQKQSGPAPQSGLHDQDRKSFTQLPCLSIAVAKSWALLSQRPYGKGVIKKAAPSGAA
jgi:hypothetical protein